MMGWRIPDLLLDKILSTRDFFFAEQIALLFSHHTPLPAHFLPLLDDANEGCRVAIAMWMALHPDNHVHLVNGPISASRHKRRSVCVCVPANEIETRG
jgi:hypothetical protein